MKVLIVDDDPELRKLIKWAVETHGASIVEAGDGEEGLAAALRERPDAIVSDGLMPRMDGFRFLRALRDHASTRSIPFLLYTAVYTTDKERELALALGADRLLVKPVNPMALWKEITDVLKERNGKTGERPSPVLRSEQQEYLENYCAAAAANLENKVNKLETTITERVRLEKAIKRAADEWMSTFDAMNDAVALLDKEGMVLRCNKAMSKLVGKGFTEIVGKSCRDIICSPSDSRVECPLDVVKRTLKRETLVTALGDRWFEVSMDPLLDDSGNLIGAVHIMADVTERKKAEEALRSSEERYRLLFQHSPIGVFHYDNALVITDCNEWFVEILRTMRERLIGMDMHVLRDKRVLPSLETVLAGKEGRYEGEYKATISEAEIFISMRTAPLFNHDGSVKGGIGIVEDITDRKRLEERIFQTKQDWEYTFNSITDMVTVHDKDYNIILANKAAEKILKLPFMEKMKDTKCFRHYHGTDAPPEGCPSCDCLKTGVPALFEIFEPHLGMFIEIRAIPRFDSERNLIGLIHVVRDITERKRMEEQINKYTERLEETVKERTKELEDANMELHAVNRELELRREEAESASRSKTDFLANMSHELRTPLNAIMGFTDIIEMGMAGPVTDKQKEFLGDISASANHLLSLINDILDLSKVEAGKLELDLSEIGVKELFESSLIMFKEKAMKHRIRIETEIDDAITSVTADRRKLKQVIVNLLSNAFKFTPDGGSVYVHARILSSSEFGVRSSGRKIGSSELTTLNPELHGNLIEISVADTGIGISPEHLMKLFQPFQQVDTKLTRKYAGTGLGLSLCRRLVELHGGRIWVESEVGKGSRFVFIIPLRQACA